MEVSRIRLDSNRFQSFLPEDQKIWETDRLVLDCIPKLDLWTPPSVFVYKPRLKRGNFLHLCSGGFVTDSEGAELLRTVLDMAGELLPIQYQGETFYLLNVLECINCLNHKMTQWVLGETTKAKIRISEYHFHPDRFSESTLFKISETARGEVLTVS